MWDPLSCCVSIKSVHLSHSQRLSPFSSFSFVSQFHCLNHTHFIDFSLSSSHSSSHFFLCIQRWAATQQEHLKPNSSSRNPVASTKIWCCVIVFFNKVFFEFVLDPSALFFSFFFSSPISFLNFILFLSSISSFKISLLKVL